MRLTTLSKGVGALGVVIFTYVNQHLSPLFWVLCALALVDILLNLRHNDVQKQMHKLVSTFAALGLPTYLSNNTMGALQLNPEVLKVIVAVLCIGYVQVVFPQIITLIGAWKFSPNKVVNAADHAMVGKLADAVEAELLARAKAQDPMAQAATPGTASASGPTGPAGS